MSLRRSFQTQTVTRNAAVVLLLAACCVWIAGCGVQAYEQRLNNANEMFAYQNRLDRILSKSAWADPYGFGVTMRLPNGYAQIPAPAAPAEGDESAEPIADPRQPTYLGITELEGLLGAWKLQSAGNSGANAFLYVVSNHHRMLAAGPGENKLPHDEFLQDLEALLDLQLGISVENGGQARSQENVKVSESLPRDDTIAKYTRRKEFVSMQLVPSGDALQQLGLPELEIYVYEHRAGSVQVALLLVAPLSVRDNPDANLRVALETLTVSDQPPRAAAPGESGASSRSGF